MKNNFCMEKMKGKGLSLISKKKSVYILVLALLISVLAFVGISQAAINQLSPNLSLQLSLFNSDSQQTEQFILGEDIIVSGNVGASGQYSVSLQLSDSSGGPLAVEQITTNSDGTFTWTINGGTILMAGNHTVNAAVGNAQAEAEFNVEVSSLSVSPQPGTYAIGTSVSLTADEGSTIYYSIDGNEPTTIYNAPLVFNNYGTYAIKAKVVKAGVASPVKSFEYIISPTGIVEKPTANLVPGLYYEPQTVNLVSIVNGANIYYTTNGSEPTLTSTRYASPIRLTQSTVIKAIAVKNGVKSEIAELAYYILIAPTASPGSGIFSTLQTVTLSTTTNNAEIHYTLDGNDPAEYGIRYTAPIILTENNLNEDRIAVIKAIVVQGDKKSQVSQFNYEVLGAPTADPVGGTYHEVKHVRLQTANENALIYYTLDGNNPTTNSKLYTGPITVNMSKTIKAITVKSGQISPVSTFNYNLVNTTLTGKITNYSGDAVNGMYVSVLNDGTAIQTVATNESGIYTVGGIWNGDYNLIIPAQKGYSKVEQPFSVNNASETTGTMNLDFTVYKGATIKGRVLDEQGGVIDLNNGQYVEVTVESESIEAGSGTVGTARIDNQGWYVIENMAAGTYTAYTYNNAGYVDQIRENITIEDDMLNTGPEFNLQSYASTLASVHGKVVTDSGEPVDNAYVEIWSPTTGSYGYSNTDAEGLYSISGLIPSLTDVADYTVSAWTYDWRKFATSGPYSLRSSEDTIINDLIIESGVSVSGSVNNSAGDPIPGVQVSVSGANKYGWGYTTTDRDGKYTITDLPKNDDYYFYLQPATLDYAQATGTFQIGDSDVQQNFVLEDAGRISGIVIGENGPLNKVNVWAWSEDGGWGRSITDNNGEYVIKGLKSGNYTVSVWVADYISDSQSDIIVSENNYPAVNFTLSKIDLSLATFKGDGNQFRAMENKIPPGGKIKYRVDFKNNNDQEASADNAVLNVDLAQDTVYTEKSTIVKHIDNGSGNNHKTLNTDVTQTSIMLEWDKIGSAKTYDVLKDNQLVKSNLAEISYLVSGLESATEYQIDIIGRDRNGDEVDRISKIVSTIKVSYDQATRVLTVSSIGSILHGNAGQVTFEANAAKQPKSNVLIASAVMQYGSQGQAKDNIGAAIVDVVHTDINGPGITKPGKVTLYGKCSQDAAIVIYGNGGTEQNFTVKKKAIAKGKWWSAEIDVNVDGNYQFYALAKVKDSNGNELSSDVSNIITIVVSNDKPVVKKVTIKAGWNGEVPVNPYTGFPALAVSQGANVDVSVQFENGENTQPTLILPGNDIQGPTQNGNDYNWNFNINYDIFGEQKLVLSFNDQNSVTYSVYLAELLILIDPSGYVYDEDSKELLQGVTAVCEKRNDKTDIWERWDAAKYGQVNPQITDEQGRYGWDVPEGDYRVLFSKTGYDSYISRIVTVPPPETQLNIGMVSMHRHESPSLTEFSPANYSDNISVNTTIIASFSKLIDHDSVNAETFKLNKNGDILSIEAEYSYQDFREVDNPYTSVTMTPKQQLAYESDYNVTVTNGILDTYNNQLAMQYNWTFSTVAVPNFIVESSPQPGTYTSAQSVTLTAVNGAVIYYTIDVAGRDPNTNDTRYTEPINVNKTMTIRAIAVLNDISSPVAVFAFTISSGTTGGGGGGGGGGVTTTDNFADINISTINNQIISGSGSILVSVSKDGARFESAVWKKVEQSGKDMVVKRDDGSVAISLASGTITLPEGSTLGIKLVAESESKKAELSKKLTSEMKMINNVYDMELLIENGKTETKATLGKPVTIIMSYKGIELTATDEEKLGIYWYNEQSGQWEYVGGIVNKTDKTVTFHVSHFSKYAMLLFNKHFTDMQNHWAKDDVEIMAAKQVAKGMPDGTFQPDNSITRAEFASLLVRTLGIKASGNEQVFNDVPSGRWYSSEVASAYGAGLVKGYDVTSFAPDAKITREQLAVMVTRAIKYAGKNTEVGNTNEILARFKDDNSVSDWAREELSSAVSAQLVNGYPDGTFKPAGNATRAESTVMLKRLLGKM